jgi:hypothetical protein
MGLGGPRAQSSRKDGAPTCPPVSWPPSDLQTEHGHITGAEEEEATEKGKELHPSGQAA